jgi:hypothetical protein
MPSIRAGKPLSWERWFPWFDCHLGFNDRILTLPSDVSSNSIIALEVFEERTLHADTSIGRVEYCISDLSDTSKTTTGNRLLEPQVVDY